MISLRKYIDGYQQELLESALAGWRSTLEAVGDSGQLACPPLGAGLRETLAAFRQRLSQEAAPDTVRETEREIGSRLDQWGQQASAYLKERAVEFKDLTLILANAAEAAGARDQRYVQQVQDFTARLRSIADLDDLREIRDSLYRSAMELKSCADKMAQESQAAVAQLRQEVKQYQSRLDVAEKMAGSDALTGLDNRRSAEACMEFRIEQGRPFSVILLDLNWFKQINDTYGHAAGDEVLKQFATELKAAFRATDMAARWGGDEFLVVLDRELGEAKSQLDRLAQWVFGEYTVHVAGRPTKIQVSAAVGVAAWKSGESAADLVKRADAAMYKDKGASARKA